MQNLVAIRVVLGQSSEWFPDWSQQFPDWSEWFFLSSFLGALDLRLLICFHCSTPWVIRNFSEVSNYHLFFDKFYSLPFTSLWSPSSVFHSCLSVGLLYTDCRVRLDCNILNLHSTTLSSNKLSIHSITSDSYQLSLLRLAIQYAFLSCVLLFTFQVWSTTALVHLSMCGAGLRSKAWTVLQPDTDRYSFVWLFAVLQAQLRLQRRGTPPNTLVATGNHL